MFNGYEQKIKFLHQLIYKFCTRDYFHIFAKIDNGVTIITTWCNYLYDTRIINKG